MIMLMCKIGLYINQNVFDSMKSVNMFVNAE